MSEAHHLIAECIRRVEGQRLDAAQRARLEQLRQWNEGVEYRGIRKLYSECEKEDGF